ncbi:MAG: hypothetical protein CMH54_00085 [Myxococcales bacterium]|nr:hypothetical protein [Myxococcales bacterium]
MKRFGTILLALMTVVVVQPAFGELPNSEQVCQEPLPDMDKYRFLRSLTLDVTGTIPAVDDYLALDSEDDVPESWLDTMLDTDAFADRVVRWHRDLLWNNISPVRTLLSNVYALRNANRVLYRSGAQATRYRGANTQCRTGMDDQAVMDGNGSYITEPFTVGNQVAQREGWVCITPYYEVSSNTNTASGNRCPVGQVAVCAFDAQDRAVSSSGTDCTANGGQNDPECGCGPNLRQCGTGTTRDIILDAFGKDVDLRVRNMVLQNRSYAELFTGNIAYVNGPIVHYWRYWAQVSTGLRNTPLPVSMDLLPDLAFTDVDVWVPMELNSAHAGVLTSPAFLLRFQTDRGRASQFYTKFLCQPFEPPSGALPVADEEAQTEPDLQLRAGCKYCHAVLEPSAAHWGRWPNAGAGYINPDEFPAFDMDCHLCATTGMACSTACNRFYSVESLAPEQDPYLGQLAAYMFLHEDNHINVEQGPRLLALQGFADNRLTECMARTVAQNLLGRDVAETEQDWLNSMVVAFATSNYNMKALVKAIVQSPLYRRVR